jgi:hypothetical protein
LRKEILEEAIEIVSGSRYETTEDSFDTIADFWRTYCTAIQRPIDSHDVAAMMILLKIARICEAPDHKDSWIDIAGYASLGGENRMYTAPSETKTKVTCSCTEFDINSVGGSALNPDEVFDAVWDRDTEFMHTLSYCILLTLFDGETVCSCRLKKLDRKYYVQGIGIPGPSVHTTSGCWPGLVRA